MPRKPATTPPPASVTEAATANDGLGVLLAMRLRLSELMDVAGAENVNIVPQIAGRLQAVNREIDERLGRVGVIPPKDQDGEHEDELARLRKRVGRAG